MSDDSKDRRGWGIDRRISVTDIIAIIGAFSAGLYAYTTLDKRIALQEQAQVAIQKEQVAQDIDRNNIRELVRESRRETREDFAVVNAKLDRIMEVSLKKERGQ